MAAVTGSAPGVSALMLFVMFTVQVIGCAASLLEPLHWLTFVTRSVELLTKVPFPPGHGSRAHSRVKVVVELDTPPSSVLTTVTVQVSAVVAPMAPGPMLLHCANESVAASADDRCRDMPATENAIANKARTIPAVNHAWLRVERGKGRGPGCHV